ncbi:hypothetical protein Golomagni_06536 [Golovinomyces magnicellulatus]|nr:hypothetical protein Golomagni_06536 [Golovinomyces magnicellulatus]
MRDPFIVAPIPWLADLVQPWCDRLKLTTLPLHIHEVVISALLYSVVFWPISPLISNYLAPEHYPKLSRKKRLNWDAHVVSMVQSCLINALAIWVLFAEGERAAMGWEERGYTGASAMIQAMAAGYFVWDLVVTSFNLDVFGIGTLAHAIAALLVYALGFRPLVNYYSSIFILWELSTPFLNLHWFMDKVNMTGSKFQLYNGILLLSSFFFSRLIYGNYQSFRAFSDIWYTMGRNPTAPGNGKPGVMVFATDASTVAPWLGLSYLASNAVLGALNVYWFFMMVKAVTKRFVPADTSNEKSDLKEEPITEIEVDVSGVASAVSNAAKPRSRRA